MTHAEICHKYMNDVINGTLEHRVACKYERLACERQLRDLQRQDDDDFPFYFDEKAGHRHCNFMSKLIHVKGKWRNTPVILEPHQIFMHFCLFAWKRKTTGYRRFTKVFWEIPRKNGKSFSVAGLGLYCAFAEGEQQAEVYCSATSEAQAQMTFSPAWQIVNMLPELKEAYGLTLAGTIRNPTSIYRQEDMSLMAPIIGIPKDGSSPSVGICDEMHEHTTSALYDSLDTGQAARQQPILAVITTAGVNLASPCFEMHVNAIKVLEGSLEQENLFVMIFAIDEDSDYQNFDVWKSVNPNYGVSINEDYLFGKYNDALNNLAQRNILLTKHLNLWSASGATAFDMIAWKKCENTALKLEDFKGQKCFVSLDLASKIDIAALEILFEIEGGHFKNCPRCGQSVSYIDNRYVCTSKIDETGCSWERYTSKRVVCFSKFYLPSDTVDKKENQTYRLWRDMGLLTVTEGARTDFQKVEFDLEQLSKDFVVQELCFDPKESAYLIQNIQKWAGFECVEVTQSPAMLSQPMKELEAMIMDCSFLHDGNPVMTWMMGNVVRKQGKSGGSVKYFYPCKQLDSQKIDGPVAVISGLSRLMVDEDNGDSYNSRAAKGEEEILRVI